MSYVFQDIICLWEVKSFFVFSCYDEKKWTCKFSHGKCAAKMNKLSSNSGAKMVNAKFTDNLNTRGFK